MITLKEVTLYKDDDIWLTAENESSIIKDGLFVHNELLTKFTPSKYKRAKQIWSTISSNLYNRGIPAIYAVPLEPHNEKWTEKFGFKYTGITLEGYKLYKHIRK